MRVAITLALRSTEIARHTLGIVTCGKCGQRIDKSLLDAHWREHHPSPKKSRQGRPPPKKSNSKALVDSQMPTARWRTCPTCGAKVKENNLERHRAKAHPKVLTKAEQKVLNKEKRNKTKLKSGSMEREYDRPIDFLDLPNVVSGGGFGVGKRRK